MFLPVEQIDALIADLDSSFTLENVNPDEAVPTPDDDASTISSISWKSHISLDSSSSDETLPPPKRPRILHITEHRQQWQPGMFTFLVLRQGDGYDLHYVLIEVKKPREIDYRLLTCVSANRYTASNHQYSENTARCLMATSAWKIEGDDEYTMPIVLQEWLRDNTTIRMRHSGGGRPPRFSGFLRGRDFGFATDEAIANLIRNHPYTAK